MEQRLESLRRLMIACGLFLFLIFLPIVLKQFFGTFGVMSNYYWTIIWLPIAYLATGLYLSRLHFVVHLIFVAVIAYLTWNNYPANPAMDEVRQLTYEIQLHTRTLLLWMLGTDLLVSNFLSRKTLKTQPIAS